MHTHTYTHAHSLSHMKRQDHLLSLSSCIGRPHCYRYSSNAAQSQQWLYNDVLVRIAIEWKPLNLPGKMSISGTIQD